MTSALLVRFRPNGPWRIGPESGSPDETGRILPSDAFFGALTVALDRLGEMQEWLAATVEAVVSAVRVSSVFPYQDSLLYALPPLTHWPPPETARVRWQDAKFVPLSVIGSLLAGQLPDEEKWAVDAVSECLVSTGRRRQGGPFVVAVRSRVAVDRLGEGVAVHRQACLEFSAGAGMWAVIEFEDEETRERWREPLRGALRLLADSGLGGGRALGWGHSSAPTFQEGPLSTLLLPGYTPGEDARGQWLLSLFTPANGEQIDWTQGNYLVTERQGRTNGTGEVKRAGKAVREGSVLVSMSPLQGRAYDVAPEGHPHPVYRVGFALSLPVGGV